MTGTKLAASQELIAQGIGNIIIPFFGGVPATAAIARTSVAIKSGAHTRIVSLVHSGILLLIVLALAPVIAQVPLAALAGVLVVTSWRMNDWHEIRAIFGQRFKSAMLTFMVTLTATVALDLTQAVVIGVGLAAVIFLVQISQARVILAPVSLDKMRDQGYQMRSDGSRITVVYVIGPLFFGTINSFNTALEQLNGTEDVILSLRTVPLLDTTGLGAIQDLIGWFEQDGRRIYLSGLNQQVRSYLDRSGLSQRLGEDRIFWDAHEAIIAADRFRAGDPVAPRRLVDPGDTVAS
jgi:SulP family sulfate permease